MPKPVTRKHLRPPYDPCRPCSASDGMTHHWLADCDEADPPTYTHTCKHCPVVGILCDACDGEGTAEEDEEALCSTCQGEGVYFVDMMPQCAWCDRRIPTPQDVVVVEDVEALFCSHACLRAAAIIPTQGA